MAVAQSSTDQPGSSWIPAASFTSLFGMFRHVSAGAFSGLITGIVVGGFGGRVFMRIAGAAAGDRAQGSFTEAGFIVGEVTVGGTIALMLFIGIFVGVAASLFYLIFQPWLSWAGRFRGVVYGVMLFAIGSATSDMMNPDNIDFLILGNGGLLVALLFGLFVLFGVVQDALFRLADRTMPGEEEGWQNIGVLYVIIFMVGVVAGLPLIAGLFNPEGLCDCEPPWVANIGVFVAFLGTAMMWIVALRKGSRQMYVVAAIVGYGGTIVALAGGLARAVSDARAIITF
ncbi:MAG: hypothetical protein ACR2N2_02730 [Acidimicrobiia bacterium]